MVAGIALSREPPPPPQSLHPPHLRYPFPLLPAAASATKLIVSPHFTPARRHALPLLAALARSSWGLGGGRERGGGTGGLPCVLVERFVTVREPVPFWSVFSSFFDIPYPLILVTLYSVLGLRGPLEYWQLLLQDCFELVELLRAQPIHVFQFWFFYFLVSLYYAYSLAPSKIYSLCSSYLFQNICWSSQHWYFL